jgi:polyisoprenoid-binding protein YceI
MPPQTSFNHRATKAKAPMRKLLSISSLSVMLMMATVPSLAQESYILGDGSTIRVDGSSNRSDWSVEATSFSGSFTFSEGAPVQGTFSIPVRDMKSGRSLIMDRLMHSTFGVDIHPEIAFSLASATPSEEEGWWDLQGDLTIAGTTNPVLVRLEQQGEVAKTVRFSGSHALLMTDFGMKPPTAMFGSLHTADEVSIHFDLLLASTCEEECESDG